MSHTVQGFPKELTKYFFFTSAGADLGSVMQNSGATGMSVGEKDSCAVLLAPVQPIELEKCF